MSSIPTGSLSASLAPALLPKELDRPVSINRETAVEFIMDYDFLPPNVMSRLIIHMKNDIRRLDHLWRAGARLSNDAFDCSALVVADMERERITITVNGSERNKRTYFSSIYHCLSNINRAFSNLKITQLMPVPGHPEIEREHEELLGLEKMGVDQLPIGQLGKVFSVSKDFLDKVSTKESGRNISQGEGMHFRISLDNEETYRRLQKIERLAGETREDTRQMRTNLERQEQYLEQLLIEAGAHRSDLEFIFPQLTSMSASESDLERVNSFLEERLNDYFRQLPTTDEIV